MKILLVADEEDKALWDYYTPSRTEGVDLIISCGDLNPDYLQFLVTMTNLPLLYVRGNHDGVYDRRPPLGCICIEDKVFDYHGIRILGLGGSRRYKPGPDMYTEEEMARRIRRAAPAIAFRNGFDLLITHAPALGYGDMDDLPHIGFASFNALLERWHPKYMCYGHVHKTYGEFVREIDHPSGTHLINCYKSFVLNIGENEHPARGKTGSALYDLYISLQRRRVGKY